MAGVEVALPSGAGSAPAAPAGSLRTARPWLPPILSCAAVLFCILLSNPFNEAGFVDDWSYGHVAMKLAETGHMQYNGWGSPILLFQAFWALPWIKLIGFSFPVLQTSMIPISLGFVLLVYAVARRIGLPAESAAFASIATGTSPLFLPSAATFMTESPGALFCMLCIYAALRCVQAPASRQAVRFLWLLAIAGVIGGANRQIVWSAPIMLIPYLAWTNRRDARFRLHAFAAYAASGLAILAVLHFFGQPYGPMLMTNRELTGLLVHDSGAAANLGARLILVWILAAVPAYACFVRLTPRPPVAWLLVSGFALLVVTLIAIVVAGLGAPYGNNVFTSIGIASAEQEWFHVKPDIMPLALRVLLSAVVNLCVFASALWLLRYWRRLLRPEVLPAISIFGLFSCGYLALTFPGTLIGFAFDRYMIPLLPLLILTLLTQFARDGRRIPAIAWCCLLVFAAFATAETHDYFEGLRTRIALAKTLEGNGVRREQISVGVEYDGWTQLQRSGYVRVVQYQDRFTDDYAKGFWFEFWDHCADFHPDFVILNWSSPQPIRGGIGNADFHTWIPPFRRTVVAWRRDDLTAQLQTGLLASMMRRH